MVDTVLQAKMKTIEVDYFIFGHRHLPLDIDLGQNTTYVNLGMGKLQYLCSF